MADEDRDVSQSKQDPKEDLNGGRDRKGEAGASSPNAPGGAQAPSESAFVGHKPRPPKVDRSTGSE